MMKMIWWWRWQWRRSWPDTECKEHTRSKVLLVVEQLLGEWGRCFAERSSSLSSISLLSKLVFIIIITILDSSFVKASSSQHWWFWSTSTCLWKLPESHFSCLQPCGPWYKKFFFWGGGDCDGSDNNYDDLIIRSYYYWNLVRGVSWRGTGLAFVRLCTCGPPWGLR